MLIQSLIPASVDDSFLFKSHTRNKKYSFDWMLGDQSSKTCPHCGECTQDICVKLVLAAESKKDSYPLSLPSYIPTPITMPSTASPVKVYCRKKLQRKPPASSPALGGNHTLADGSNPAPSSESLYGSTNAVSVDVETEGFQSLLKLSEKSENEGINSKSGSCNGCPDSVVPCSDESLRSDTGRGLDHRFVDDSCSSSKLNLDIISAPLKPVVNDTGECSSSGVSASEGMWDNMSEKDILISILRSQGLLENGYSQQDQASAERNGMTTGAWTCRACDRSDSTVKMLICDQCEDTFHASCCNPRIRRIPIREWFCYSCLKKRRKLLVENPSSSASVSNGSPISLMLEESGTYHSIVRLGSGYQAEVPTWSGPVIDEIRSVNELPKQMAESEYLNLDSQDSIRILSLSSVGNWLQCQAVVRDVGGGGIDGTICGKWRRAPLFEVQTDNWECFCTVLWDSSHADCAVPQELPTDEVLKQLKYIEMLRPRIAAKKRKLDRNTVGSQDSKQIPVSGPNMSMKQK